MLLEIVEICCHLPDNGIVLLLGSKIEQLGRISEAGLEFVERDNDLLETRPLPAERLGSVGLAPDIGLLQFALDLGQPFRLLLVVKDTSSTRWRVPRGH